MLTEYDKYFLDDDLLVRVKKLNVKWRKRQRKLSNLSQCAFVVRTRNEKHLILSSLVKKNRHSSENLANEPPITSFSGRENRECSYRRLRHTHTLLCGWKKAKAAISPFAMIEIANEAEKRYSDHTQIHAQLERAKRSS